MTGAAAAAATIFALSSGLPPAAIAVVRISGPHAGAAVRMLAGRPLPPRQATLARLRDDAGETLDRALLLWFPGPATATGEDLAELHLHGGRAVVAAVLDRLAALPGLRAAEAGEFTRRAFLNGRIDLAAAEGLADLLAAETEEQRRQAIRQAEGGLGRLIAGWRDRVVALSARVEAAIEFGDDEDDVRPLDRSFLASMRSLIAEIDGALAAPPAERLRDGIRVVFAGPVNAGKSSLINVLAGRSAAIVSDIAGTTRDLIEVPVTLSGIPIILIDGAGLRDTVDVIEAIGVERAQAAIATCDILIWLGDPDRAPDHANRLLVRSKADLAPDGGFAERLDVSSLTGHGISGLTANIIQIAKSLLPRIDQLALTVRQSRMLREAWAELHAAIAIDDPLLLSEHLRSTRLAFDRIVGAADTESMLDSLFGQFCVGK